MSFGICPRCSTVYYYGASSPSALCRNCHINSGAAVQETVSSTDYIHPTEWLPISSPAPLPRKPNRHERRRQAARRR